VARKVHPKVWTRDAKGMNDMMSLRNLPLRAADLHALTKIIHLQQEKGVTAILAWRMSGTTVRSHSRSKSYHDTAISSKFHNVITKVMMPLLRSAGINQVFGEE
jgi:hypothetical protein